MVLIEGDSLVLMKKTIYIAKFLLIAGISLSNLLALNIKLNCGTSYYEKYNPDTKLLSNSPYSQTTNFFIDSGRLSADGICYTLSGALEVELTQEVLKEYDLQTVVIKIDNNLYKTKPSFKKLFLQPVGKRVALDVV